MPTRSARYLLIFVITILFSLPLLLLTHPAPRAAEGGTACPPLPDVITVTTDLDDVIETDHFCVRYRQGPTSDYSAGVLSQVDASIVAIHAENYWDRFVNDFQFPTFWIEDPSGKLSIWMIRGNEPDIVTYANFGPGTGCNGKAAPGIDVAFVRTGCFNSVDGSLKNALGHEIFHHIQNGVMMGQAQGTGESTWFIEGTSRAMEDHVFSDLDNWPDALSAPFSFNREVDKYLTGGNTNQDLTTASYRAALWWKYFMEQIGTTPAEPELGVDALQALWLAAVDQNGIAVIDEVLADQGLTFNDLFQPFVLANWTKDLNVGSLPDASTYYMDEQQAGNPAPYGPIDAKSGGTLSAGFTWSGEEIARYGAQYYRVGIDNNSCQIVTVEFDKTDGKFSKSFYYVVTQKGQDVETIVHYEGPLGDLGGDWAQSFVNDGLTQMAAIAGSLVNTTTVDISFTCADPLMNIVWPTADVPAYVGEHDDPGKILVAVSLTDGAGGGPVVGGLSKDNFTALVNNQAAPILAGGFIQEQYWLEVQAPEQAADGVFDLSLSLQAPGSNSSIASDVNALSVIYEDSHGDQVVIIDRSGSMADDGKMAAAQDAANFYVDITRNNDGLSVVPFRGAVLPEPFDMQSVNNAVRAAARAYIDGLSPNGNTSIGAGLEEAVSQINGSPTGNERCLFVLLSDGMENTAPLWNEVDTEVIGTGCPVMTVAFGPTADEMLLQDIAEATGGLPFYNDVFSSAQAPAGLPADDITALGLGDTYEYAQSRSEGRQRFLSQPGVIPSAMTVQIHPFVVDTATSELLLALDWNNSSAMMQFQVKRPDGTMFDLSSLPSFFLNQNDSYMGAWLAAPEPGKWELHITFTEPTAVFNLAYNAYVGGHSDLSLTLLLPGQVGGDYLSGDEVPIYALVSDGEGPISDAVVEAMVTLPNGTAQTLPLFDDGMHGDAGPGDGLYANWFTRVSETAAVAPSAEGNPDPVPENIGGYRVIATAQTTLFQRQALGAFSVPAGPDADGDRLPDNWEARYGVDDPGADDDLDALSNGQEFTYGTIPNDSDTDDGGQNDGSELQTGLNPLNGGDDQIATPLYFEAVAQDDAVVLNYDAPAAYTGLAYYRAFSPDGPWTGPVELPFTQAMTDVIPINGQTTYYQLIAYAEAGEPVASGAYGSPTTVSSALLATGPVTPSADPFPPEGEVAINEHADSTDSLAVLLSFYAGHGEMAEFFDDIVQMKISNDPYFTQADWQPFQVQIPWQLEAPTGDNIARVYVRFRDAAGNESPFTATDAINYLPAAGTDVYLPVIVR